MGFLGGLFRGARASMQGALGVEPTWWVLDLLVEKPIPELDTGWLAGLERAIGYRLMLDWSVPFRMQLNHPDDPPRYGAFVQHAVLGLFKTAEDSERAVPHVQRLTAEFRPKAHWRVILKPGCSLKMDFEDDSILVSVPLDGGSAAHHKFSGITDLGRRCSIIVSDRANIGTRIQDIENAWGARRVDNITAQEYEDVKRTLVPSDAALEWQQKSGLFGVQYYLHPGLDLQQLKRLSDEGALTSDEACRLNILGSTI